MTTRPANDQLSTAVTFSPVTVEDFDELVALRIAAMRESLERVGRFDPERARERLRKSFHPGHTQFVILDGQRIGFYTFRPADDGFHLDHLYVHPRCQSRGIGSHVIRHLLSQADVHRMPVHLGALRQSASNRFYQRHGFVQVREDEWDICYVRTPTPNEPDNAQQQVGWSLPSPVNESISIRAFRVDDAIPPITALLHSAYAPLARMGFRYLATHQDDATTLQRLQRGFAFVAESDGSIVGTITLRPPPAQSDCAWYLRPGVFSFGQFAVHPDFQRRGIGLRLLRFVEQEAHSCGASQLALDTAEGAAHLCQWYDRLGFRFIEYVSWPDTNYRSVVLSKQLTGNHCS